MVSYIQDKAKVAKEGRQDSRRLPAGGGGGGSRPDGDGDRDPTDQDRDSSSEPGGNGFPFRRRRGGGGPPEDPDPEDDDGIPRGFQGRQGPRGYLGPQGPEGPRGPPGLMGPRGIPRGLSSTGLGDTPTIPKCEYNSGGKFIAVRRRIPVSVDANSAECKPKYGRSPKFNSRSARRVDSRTNQVGRKYLSTGVRQAFQRYTNIRWRGSG